MKTSLIAILALCVLGATTAMGQTGVRIFGAQQLQIDDNNPAHPKVFFTNNVGSLGIDQNGIVTAGVFPSPCALLDLSSTTQGFLPPRMTTLQEGFICGGTPTEGLVVYNTTTHTLDVWNGSGWTGQWQTKGNTNLTVDNTDNLLGSTATSLVKPFNLIVGGARIMRYQTGNDIIGGAPANAINGSTTNSVIAGGGTNTIATNSSSSVIAGGANNTVSNAFASIGGGTNNTASGSGAHIGGGGTDGLSTSGNTASGGGSVVGGGITNVAAGVQSFVGGGQNDKAMTNNASVVGGVNNTASGMGSFIGGGGIDGLSISGNTASGGGSVVVGGITNSAAGIQSFVGGGQNNHATINNATVVGGVNNTASGFGSTIAGGGYDGTSVLGNTGSGNASFVGGGMNNTASGSYSLVSGGLGNSAGAFSAVAGGTGLTLGTNSFGYNAPDVGANLGGFANTAYFGNVDVWVGNTGNAARQLRFYAPNSSTTYAGALYTSLQASSATTGTTQYALPVNYGSTISPYVLTDASGIGTPRQLSWQSVNGLGWALTGNSGTNPATNFVGTNDNNDFVIRTNNIVRATFAGTPVAGGVKPMFNINTVSGFQGVRINGVADAIPGPGGSTLAGTPDVWELAVVGDFVASGIIKMGGSMWFDGNSPTHTIVTNKPLLVQTMTNDSLMFGTNGQTAMTIATNGYVGIGTMNPRSPMHIRGTPPMSSAMDAIPYFHLPDPENHVLTVENMQSGGLGNGIAIIVHNPASSNKITDGQSNNEGTNYITFYNDVGDHNHIRGRIESFSYQNFNDMVQAMYNVFNNYPLIDLANPFNYFTCNLGFDTHFMDNAWNPHFLDNVFTLPTFPTLNAGSWPSLSLCDLYISMPDGIPNIDLGNILPCGLSGGSWPSLSGGSIGSICFNCIQSPINFTQISSPITNITNPFSINYSFINGFLSQVAAIPYKQKLVDIISSGPKMAVVKAAATYAMAFYAGGVTYESGSGDYAEWLERADHNENITFGDVVGVVGGKISKNTEGATQYLIASFKPCVLGNMPVAGQEQNFNKVAFMGQVPVKITVPVKKGDYIVPDGRNDGFALAISPEDIRTEDLDKVVGVSWEDNPHVGIKFVNVAVGLKPHEVIKVIQDQQKELDELKAEVADIKASLHTAQLTKLAKKHAKHAKQMSSN